MSKCLSKLIPALLLVTTLLPILITPNQAHAATKEALLLPKSDIEKTQVQGIGDPHNLYRNVDDGTSFAASDDNTTYVGQTALSSTSIHTVGYADPSISSGVTTDVTVYYRAKRGSSSTTAQIQLYDGDILLGTGKINTLSSSWTNFSDTFTGLSVAKAGNLRTRLILKKLTGSSSPRITQIFIKATINGLSETDEQTLTANLETLSNGWDNSAVGSANSILSKPEYTTSDWQAYFEKFFNTTNHTFTNSLNDYLGYPTFFWFDDALHQKLQSGLTTPLWNKINSDTAAHASSLGQDINADASLRQNLFNSHRFFANLAKYGTSTSAKNTSYTNYKNHINTYPSLWKASTIFNTATHPYVATLRAQIWMSFRDLPSSLDTATKSMIATTLGLSGRYLDIWNNFTTLVHDNNGFSAAQNDFIFNLLSNIPGPLLDLGNITQVDLLGNTGSRFEYFINKSGVNVFNTEVGTVSENSFPDDITPGLIDGFGAVNAHEYNHVVEAGYINNNLPLKNRRDALLAQAGTTSLQYLRSMFGNTFFQSNPQEFIASISNQWFTDSKHTLDLGLQRFDSGYKEPLNQALYFVDLYSVGSTTSKFYRIDTNGTINVTTVTVERDNLGRVNVLTYGNNRYNFTLDPNGNVTGYTITPQ